MCISDKQTLSEKPTFLFGKDELCTVDKYNNLYDNDDIYRQVRSMDGRANPICKKNQFLLRFCENSTFNSYCANMYCCQLWCKYTVANYNKLNVELMPLEY